jgi:hypothetical protein
MQLGRRETKLNSEPDFDWLEVPCASGEDAQAEAARQQLLDDPDAAEWIYLRNKDHQWVARRTPRNLPLPKPTKRSRFLDLLAEFIPSGS